MELGGLSTTFCKVACRALYCPASILLAFVALEVHGMLIDQVLVHAHAPMARAIL
jgi:hypothetical protein